MPESRVFRPRSQNLLCWALKERLLAGWTKLLPLSADLPNPLQVTMRFSCQHLLVPHVHAVPTPPLWPGRTRGLVRTPPARQESRVVH